MKCIIVTDRELAENNLHSMLGQNLPIYMVGSPASIRYDPLCYVYIVPSTHPAYSWLAVAGVGHQHDFDPLVLTNMGWLQQLDQ